MTAQELVARIVYRAYIIASDFGVALNYNRERSHRSWNNARLFSLPRPKPQLY